MKKHLKCVLSFVLSLTMAAALAPASAFALEVETISTAGTDSTVTGVLGAAAVTGIDQYGYGTLWTVSDENDGDYLVGTSIGVATWYIGADEEETGALALVKTPSLVALEDTSYNGNAAIAVSVDGSTGVFYLVSVSDAGEITFGSVASIGDAGQFYLYDVASDAYLIATAVTVEGEEQTALVNSLNLTRTVSEEYLDDEDASVDDVEFTYVLYHNDAAEAGVEYTLYDADGNQAGTGTTSDAGEFTFKNGYTVTFSGIAMDESNSWYAAEKVSVFTPSSISVSCSYASKTKKATVTVLTSKDVSYVTIDGETATQKNASGKYRFTLSYTKVTTGTTYEIIAYDADGVASQVYTVTAE